MSMSFSAFTLSQFHVTTLPPPRVPRCTDGRSSVMKHLTLELKHNCVDSVSTWINTGLVVTEVVSYDAFVKFLSLPVLRADGAASANPSSGPPTRAQPPSVARGNGNNIVRDGVSSTPPDRASVA